jgi:cell division protein FtsQ
MPAVMRGGGRAAVRPRAKAPPKSGKPRTAKPAPRGASKLRAARQVGLSPGIAVLGAVAVLTVGVAVALGTGGRGQKLADASAAAVTARAADAGFKVTTVHLQGASKAAQGEILKAAALHRDQPLLGLDLDAVRARVERVGWVKSARVIRLLPDTVVIAVDQRPLLAVWQHRGRVNVVDADGAVVGEADPSRFPDLPLIVGEGANTAAASILPAVNSRPRLLQRLEALVRVDDRRWDLRLKDGSLIQLPAENEEAALIRLDQLDRASRILELGFARVDLRDPEMVAVRPRGAMAPAGQVAGGV